MAQAYDQLQPGTMVVDRWRVEKRLAIGVGAVYKVIDSTTNSAFVLKTAPVNDCLERNALTWEQKMLSTLEAKGFNRHICNIKDIGRVDNTFNYMVQTMVSQSLRDLLYARAGRKLTIGCTISIGKQCLEAIEDVHNAGYIYRQVQPDRFHIGSQELGEQCKIYLLGFNQCHEIAKTPRKSHGHVRPPGDRRFWPLICHQHNMDNWSLKDDLEQWIYLLIVLVKGALPWHDVNLSDKEIDERKLQCRSDAGMDELFTGCPHQFHDMWRLIIAYKFKEVPDYARLYALMRDALITENATEFPYDWELPAAN